MLWTVAWMLCAASAADRCIARCQSQQAQCVGQCAGEARCGARCGSLGGLCLSACNAEQPVEAHHQPKTTDYCGVNENNSPRRCTEKELKERDRAIRWVEKKAPKGTFCPGKDGVLTPCPEAEKKALARVVKEAQFKCKDSHGDPRPCDRDEAEQAVRRAEAKAQKTRLPTDAQLRKAQEKMGETQ